MDEYLNDEYELTNDEVIDVLRGIIDDDNAVIHVEEVEVRNDE